MRAYFMLCSSTLPLRTQDQHSFLGIEVAVYSTISLIQLTLLSEAQFELLTLINCTKHHCAGTPMERISCIAVDFTIYHPI